jgi:hypothetical protein
MIELTKIEMGNHIPKVIHQIYPCKACLAKKIQENIRKICRINSFFISYIINANFIALVCLGQDSERNHK